MELEYSDFLCMLNKQDILILTETWKRKDSFNTFNNKDCIEYTVCHAAVKTKQNSGGITDDDLYDKLYNDVLMYNVLGYCI